MKKVFSWIFTACVLLISAALFLGFFFPSQAGANEQLAAAPALQNKDGSWNENFLADTADWFQDHFFGRQRLISTNNYLTAHIFGTSASDDVILGKDGWLYYAPTLPDYNDENPLSDRQLFSMANNLALMEEYCLTSGRQFVFTIAPNKNSLYPQAMHSAPAANSNAQRLLAALKARGVTTADLYAAFGAENEVLYFAHDSHWNSKGAALGADTVLSAFGMPGQYYQGSFVSQPHQGDLYEMLYPAFSDQETDLVYAGALDFTYTGNANKPDSITLLTESSRTGSLLCYRDSFGNLLYSYLASSFGSCRFSRSVTYDLTQDGNYVLIELVERNLPYLIKNLPVMPAIQREITPTEAFGTIALTQKSGDLLRVTGTLPAQPDADSPVYILCGDTAYEAFCLQDNSFGAYLDTDAAVTGIAFYADGALQTYTAQ